MATAPLSDELARQAADAYRVNGHNKQFAADALGIPRNTFLNRLKRAAERGMLLNHAPAMPGYTIKSVASKDVNGAWIKQTKEPGEEFAVPNGHAVKGVSALVDGDGRTIQQWIKTREDVLAQEAAMRAVVEALKEELPRAAAVQAPVSTASELLNQYTVTDLHFGMLSWGEETGADYDLKIAEQLLLDWFTAAIRMSPDANTAILCQLGDLLHHDSHESVTPAHRNILDADSRLQKIIRVVIRTKRRIVTMLLEKHARVHIVMADANHDPASGAWLRELFAAFFENEPRVTVDTSPSTYYAYEFGLTSLFYHHGHKKKIKAVDSVFAGKFREIYGRTKFAYGHTGHLHSDELISTNLMKVERHETLAAADAYAANGGWLSGRSAKVITYSKRFGEVGRITLTPEMVKGDNNETNAPNTPQCSG